MTGWGLSLVTNPVDPQPGVGEPVAQVVGGATGPSEPAALERSDLSPWVRSSKPAMP
jgi:hypothetical protein